MSQFYGPPVFAENTFYTPLSLPQPGRAASKNELTQRLRKASQRLFSAILFVIFLDSGTLKFCQKPTKLDLTGTKEMNFSGWRGQILSFEGGQGGVTNCGLHKKRLYLLHRTDSLCQTSPIYPNSCGQARRSPRSSISRNASDGLLLERAGPAAPGLIVKIEPAQAMRTRCVWP